MNSIRTAFPIASALKLSYDFSFRGPAWLITEDSINSAGEIANKSKSTMFVSMKSVGISSPSECERDISIVLFCSR